MRVESKSYTKYDNRTRIKTIERKQEWSWCIVHKMKKGLSGHMSEVHSNVK